MNAPMIRILIVEDEKTQAQFLRRTFDDHADRFRLTIAHTLEDARTCLAESPPDLVIVDWILPDGAGTSLLPGKDEAQAFPVLVMTSHGDEQVAVEAMKAGALDYIVKSPEMLADMPHIVERALREWGHIAGRKRAERIQSALFHISQAASESDDLEDIVAVIHQQLGTLLPVTNFYVALYDEKQGLYSFPYSVNERDTEYYPQPLHGSLTDYVRRTGKPLLLDADGDQQLIKEGEVEMVGASMASWLGVPLKTAQRVFGVMVVQSYTENALYTDRDLELLVIVADSIASVIERKQAEASLRESEARYRSLFEDSPTSLWEEDFSAIKAFIDTLHDSGVSDFRTYFTEHPETVAHCASLMKVRNVNQATLRLLNRETKEDLLQDAGAGLILSEPFLNTFREELIDLTEGKTQFQHTLIGERRQVIVSVSVAPGHESTWEKIFVSIVDITERKQAEAERLAHLHYLQSIERVDQIIVHTIDPEQLLEDVVEVIFDIFDSDRAWLLYPSDPDASFWCVPVEHTRPEYPGAHVVNEDIPMTPDIAEVLRAALVSGNPLVYDPTTDLALPPAIDRFSVRSQMLMAIHPRMGDAWMLGMHQCSHARVWTAEEQRLFRDIGHRVTEALSNLLFFQSLRESEARYRSLFEDSPISLWEEDFSAIKDYIDDLRDSGVTDFGAYFEANPEAVAHCVEAVRVLNVNQATMSLFKAKSKEDLYAGLSLIFDEDSHDMFREELVALAEGKTQFEGEVVQHTLAGDRIQAVVSFSVAPGYEETWTKVFVSIINITERKRAEKALIQERNLLRTVMNSLPDNVSVKDTEGHFLISNPEVLRFLEVASQEELDGKTDFDFLPHELAAEFLAKEQAIMQTGKPMINREYKLPEQIVQWYLITKVPLRDHNGEIVGIVSVNRDITERKLAEEELLREKTFSDATITSLPGIFYVYDEYGKFLRWNRNFETVSGYSGDEIAQMLTEDFFPPDERARVNEAIQEMFVKGMSSLEANFMSKDGSTTPYLLTGARFEIGGVLCLAGMGMDITERKRLEAELQRYTENLEDLVEKRTMGFERAKRRVETILNNTNDAIVLAQTNGTIEQTNKAFDELFGYQSDEAFGLHLATFVEPDDADRVTQAIQAVVEDEQPQRFEVVAQRQDKTTFDGDATIAPVREHDGNLSGVVFSLRDITHFKEVERVKTQFIANAAHDLSNPITNLKLRLHALRRAPKRLREHMAVLESEMRRLEYLVSDLRTLSQLDHGSLALESASAPFDLNALVAEVIEAHRPLAESKTQTLVFEPTPDLALIQAGRRNCERVVVNLVTNALNYTPNRGTITVITQNAPNFAMFTVRDTGIGIAPKDLPHIFERFYRSDEAKTSSVEGTGLGLPIVKEITEAYGGQIQVESLPGQGATFTVSLPTIAQ